MSKQLTIVLPYYRQPEMLRQQLLTWYTYSQRFLKGVELVVVDDGSPEEAKPIVATYIDALPLSLYRIKTDIPWNRGGARNLGAFVADTPWILHIDTDHVLPAPQADKLDLGGLSFKFWYRFRRFRNGAADETRMKDALPREAKFGEIKPHIDSYLIPRAMYWNTGGYDEDYSGCLGGGSPFLKRLEQRHKCVVLNEALWVYTRDVIPDASVNTLSRDTGEYTRRRQDKERRGATDPINPMRFDWERVY